MIFYIKIKSYAWPTLSPQSQPANQPTNQPTKQTTISKVKRQMMNQKKEVHLISQTKL